MAALSKADLIRLCRERRGTGDDPAALSEYVRAVATAASAATPPAALLESARAVAAAASAVRPPDTRHPTAPADALLADAKPCWADGVAGKPPSAGGRPSVIPPEITVRVTNWLAMEGIPGPVELAPVERKIHELLAAVGRSAGETTVRNHARRLIDEYRRILHEGP